LHVFFIRACLFLLGNCIVRFTLISVEYSQKSELSSAKESERNNLRNAFFNSNEIMEQRVESFKYSVKIESSYFVAGTKLETN